ncbi:MAG: bifunctional 4-hydroxy-3-methylbut-2-enyl diphosphate reductase/30S ribosomal protein S1 [Ruminiclostridium sp.]|nr:bifunctional 4-hydroxy-3-methylbut-2-enyl diphosphate reductase/30S ribosomal protein S1 [Ruminiclostridium sp.]
MKIIVAKSAGFCFGVDKAVNNVYDLLDKNEENICTLGPIIHNDQVVNDLKARGVNVITDISEALPEGKVVIRTHGVTPDIYEKLAEHNLEAIDATCPYVKKIHNLVKKKYDEGYKIIIAGDADHPEVKGINGWCNNSAYIADSPEDVDKIPVIGAECCIVAQTTITKEKWDSINIRLQNKCKNLIKFDTICNATSSRQSEAEKIAKAADVMIVVGSKSSSNTQKLYEISKIHCPRTYNIETFGDLPPIDITDIEILGITAGASTPDVIIKEVLEKMEELNKQENEMNSNEMNFKEAFESSLVTLQSGEIVKGKIIGFNNAEIYVDLGYKSDGIIAMSEYSDDPDFKPEAHLKAGDEIEVYIVRVNDGEGSVQLSKKKVDSMRSIDDIEEAFENKTTVTAKVTEVTNGGLIASAKGVRIFIPASQISDRYVKDLGEYLRRTVKVRIVEFNKQKRKIVGSQKVILAEEKERSGNEFWDNVEAGRKYEGAVKSLMDFGAFVDIGGVDGLVHVSELSWNKVKHPSEVLKVGDLINVTVLEFDREKKRISLGYKKSEDNPWIKAAEKYKVGDLVKGKVVRLVPFGAFVELEKGIDGLVHISQISNMRIAKPGDVLSIGQDVEAKVVEFNLEAKKISLSIKEATPIDTVQPVTEAKADEKGQAEAEEIIPDIALPIEHKEEMTNTIGDAISGLGKISAEQDNEKGQDNEKEQDNGKGQDNEKEQENENK